MNRRIFNFPGGIALREHKRVSTTSPVTKSSLPDIIVLPLNQHIGSPSKPVVNLDDSVLKGQLIAEAANDISVPLHAPTSGKIVAIESRPVPHPSGLAAQCIVIKPDGIDQPITGYGEKEESANLSPTEVIQKIRQAGIVGLGGAGFPSYMKLANESNATGNKKGNNNGNKSVDTLILNGIECEPYITCDQMLMQSQPEDIINGMLIMQRALDVKRCIVAIENNKPKAFNELTTTVKNNPNASHIEIVKVPTVYPAGGEKQLIQTLTNREVPSQGLPMDIGIVCHNVGTAHAISRALEYNEPLISRYVTVVGSVAKARVLEVLIGTPISHLIEECGGNRKTLSRVIMGGPMMGFALHDDDTPIVKITNCILVNATIGDVPLPSRSHQAMPCIRCGACAEACPVSLLPQQLYWYARAKEFDKIQDYNLFDCIECGCCDYVCPSHIPLVKYYRYAKSTIWKKEHDKINSDISRQRHDFRNLRLERTKLEREERHKKKRKTIDAKEGGNKKQAAIKAAMDRVREKREASKVEPKNIEYLTEQQQILIDEVDARRKKKLGS
jgi:electron transport complex protein RnfC